MNTHRRTSRTLALGIVIIALAALLSPWAGRGSQSSTAGNLLQTSKGDTK